MLSINLKYFEKPMIAAAPKKIVSYEDYPKLESPNCFTATLACYLKKRFLLEDVKLAHFEHEYHIRNPDSSQVTGIHSSLTIEPGWDMSSTESVLSHRVFERLKQRYGIKVRCAKFNDFRQYFSALDSESFHVMSAVDPYFMAASPYYLKDHAFSVCIVNGKDSEKGLIHFVERKHQQSQLTFDEFEDNFNYFVNSRGAMEIYFIERELVAFDIDHIDIRQDLQRVTKHMLSNNEASGINALSKFIVQYPVLLAQNKPFLVPWTERCFGECYANSRFLEGLLSEGHKFALENKQQVHELINHYDQLANLWRSFELFHLFSVSNNDHKILHRNRTILDEIFRQEQSLLDYSIKALSIFE
jgi:hypothetical protein